MNANKERPPFVRKEVVHFLPGFLSMFFSWSECPFVFMYYFLLFPFNLFCEVYFDWYWFNCSNNYQKKTKIRLFKLALFTVKREETLFLSAVKPVKAQEVLVLFLVQLQRFHGKVTIITTRYSFDLTTYLKGQLGSALKGFICKPLAE